MNTEYCKETLNQDSEFELNFWAFLENVKSYNEIVVLPCDFRKCFSDEVRLTYVLTENFKSLSQFYFEDLMNSSTVSISNEGVNIFQVGNLKKKTCTFSNKYFYRSCIF